MTNVQFEDINQPITVSQISSVNTFSKPAQFLVRIGVVKTDAQANFLMSAIGLVCVALIVLMLKSSKPDFSSIPEDRIIRMPGEPAFIRR